MKISINKEYTNGSQMGKVKEDIKTFKEVYTEGDLYREFYQQGEHYELSNGDIVKMEIEAYPGGSYYNDETHFTVNMLIDCFTRIYKVRFYTNMRLEVRQDIGMIDKFNLER